METNRFGISLQNHTMADAEVKSIAGKSFDKPVLKKLIRIDLTPMVDLGFLLITFFVFTTTMSRATVMDIKTPFAAPPADEVCNSCALTILLDKDDAVYYYTGAYQHGKLQVSNFNSIRKEIQQQQQALVNSGRNKSQFSLIIKSSDSARFHNFIDIMDEVAINRVHRYYIDEVTAAEESEMHGK